MAYKSTHIVQITDTADRNARLRISSAYTKHAGSVGLKHYRLDIEEARNTLDIGVAASELVHNTERADQLLLALNCAPAEKKEGTTDNHRSDFFYADLGDGVFAGGTIAGFELAYLKDRIKSLYRLTTTNALDSQFRSLQVLPKHLVRFADKKRRAKLIEKGHLVAIDDNDIDTFVQSVPDITHVIEVDQPFKNVKLWVSREDREALKVTEKTYFDFGSQSIEYAAPDKPSNVDKFNALVRPSLFAVPLGENVIALRSSSRVLGSENVPMIATIRKRPAETDPNYTVPSVGQPAFLKGLHAA